MLFPRATVPGDPTLVGERMDKKKVGAWALFDFANSIYPAVITTAVFSLFYKNVVVSSEGGDGDR